VPPLPRIAAYSLQTALDGLSDLLAIEELVPPFHDEERALADLFSSSPKGAAFLDIFRSHVPFPLLFILNLFKAVLLSLIWTSFGHCNFL